MSRINLRISAVVVLAVSTIALSEWDLEWHTVDGGGAMRTTSNHFELSGTIGQADAGRSNGPTLTLTGGFWFEQVPGDCTFDGALNLDDAAAFGSCNSGPVLSSNSSTCECLDFDGDGDVDLRDAAEFQLQFGAQ